MKYDKNGCIKGYPHDIGITSAATHTITAHDEVQPNGTIKRTYTASAPTLKLGYNEGTA